jgi:hypothetical protein
MVLTLRRPPSAQETICKTSTKHHENSFVKHVYEYMCNIYGYILVFGGEMVEKQQHLQLGQLVPGTRVNSSAKGQVSVGLRCHLHVGLIIY